jgi:hypothetical protein
MSGAISGKGRGGIRHPMLTGDGEPVRSWKVENL